MLFVALRFQVRNWLDDCHVNLSPAPDLQHVTTAKVLEFDVKAMAREEVVGMFQDALIGCCVFLARSSAACGWNMSICIWPLQRARAMSSWRSRRRQRARLALSPARNKDFLGVNPQSKGDAPHLKSGGEGIQEVLQTVLIWFCDAGTLYLQG